MKKRGGQKLYLVSNFLATYALLAITLIFTFSLIFYFTLFRSAFGTLRYEAEDTAVAIAASVDFTGFETLTSSSQESTAVYRRIFNDLYFSTRINPKVEFVYTMRRQEDGKWVFVVDADPVDDDNGNGVIDSEELSADIGEVYDETCCPQLPLGLYGPSSDGQITSDAWGSWISGYAPIHNAEGNVVGIVGVDIDASQLTREQDLLQRLLFIIWINTIFVSFLFGGWGTYVFVSEQKKVEEALTIRNSELEKMAKKRTDALQRFNAMLVHELRAPLTGIKWTTEEMQLGNLTKNERVEKMQDVYNATEEMLDLVNKFLDSSKLSLNQFYIEKKRGNIRPIIQSVVNTFSAVAEHKGLKVNTVLPRTIPSFLFDKERVTQVLNNLISNAIKYTNKGDVSLVVTVDRVKNVLRIQVIDSGIGIAKKNRERIFEPFHRVKESGQTGSGLGLAIAKGIVDAHKGRLTLESTLHKGSTFTIELPLK